MSAAVQHPDNPWVPREKLLVVADSKINGTDRTTVEKSTDFDENKALTAWYAPDRQHVDPLPDHRRIPVWTEPVHPHLGGSAEEVGRAGWWWLGVHGGSGVNSLMRFLPGGADSHRWWPDPAFGGPQAVILVCRTHLSGLERAREAATQWAADDVPAGLLLAGAVAVADAPGRLDRAAAEALRLLEGAVPRLWSVPWLDDLRCLAPGQSLPLPPALLALRSDLATFRPRRAGRSPVAERNVRA